MKNFPCDLKVNWHFTDYCNMKCLFCFASKSPQKANLNYESVLNKFPTLFRCVNFVGGEPTLAPYFPKMVDYAQSIGLETTLVTNAFYVIKTSLFDNTLAKMTTVGISIDSLCASTNQKTGRHVNGYTLSANDLKQFCKKLKNMGVKLKINTVVNQYNKNEDFNAFIDSIEPYRWKLLQVLPTGKESDKYFQINQYEFSNFLERHKDFAQIIAVEDNELLTNSYLMVNQDGYFIDTAPYTIKAEQKSLFGIDTDIAEEFSYMNYNLTKYQARYAQ